MQRRRTPLSVVAPIGFSVAVAGSWNEWWIGPAIAGVAVGFGVWFTFDTWLESKDPSKSGKRINFWHWRAVWLPALAAALSFCVARAAFVLDGQWQLLAIPLPVLVLGIYNTSRPARSHWQARRLVKKRAREAAEDAFKAAVGAPNVQVVP